MTELFLFAVVPYLSVALAIAGGLYRYLVDRYSWSAQSSQFLENRLLYWGSVPWHYAVLLVLLAHLLAFLFPAAWGSLLGNPERLYLLEATGLALGVCTLLSAALLLFRRVGDARVSTVTSVIDWVVLLGLLLQVATGIYIAFTLRWGSVWYVHTAAPWLWSLVKFDPQIQFVSALPAVVKVHAVGAFILIALFPFSRLVHIVSVPLTYLTRPYQVVIWNRRQAGR